LLGFPFNPQTKAPSDSPMGLQTLSCAPNFNCGVLVFNVAATSVERLCADAPRSRVNSQSQPDYLPYRCWQLIGLKQAKSSNLSHGLL